MAFLFQAHETFIYHLNTNEQALESKDAVDVYCSRLNVLHSQFREFVSKFTFHNLTLFTGSSHIELMMTLIIVNALRRLSKIYILI